LKALIIEDSADVVEAVSLCLQLRWPEVIIFKAAEGNRGIEIILGEPVDILILDLNLPDSDGFDVLKKIRSLSNVPIVILTVRGKEDDQAKGLEMGADDYIVKPFRARDLVARINAVLRRSQTSQVIVEQSSLTRGELTLNLSTNSVQLGDKIARLSPIESRVLYTLMHSAENTLNIKTISQEIWGKELGAADSVRTVIRRLRNKLDDSPPRIITNQRGEGYKFVNPV
jgi:DNA-binding response OmpR family regulator